MKTVTVSSKYQVVIPRDLRRQLNIQVGQKLKARVQGDHIELVPEPPLTAARGFLPGLDAKVERENDRT
jgi:AbrB family looped-hinge helix DNA binding protein